MRKPKYRQSLPARFWLWRNRALAPSDIYIHLCSYGEAIAIKPLIEAWKSRRIALSAITKTGREVIAKYTSNSAYLPFELWLPFWMRKHRMLILIEAELWYLLVLLAKRKGTHTILLNARITDRSFGRYWKMRWFYREIFAHIDAVFCQTSLDQERLEALGARNVRVIGNIKLATKIVSTRVLPKPAREMIVAASTHEGEEELILASYRPTPKSVLVVVPRHPERFDAVDTLLRVYTMARGLHYHRYSQEPHFESDVVLVDTMGELINIYAISDVVILGGAFASIGGHNPLEPAHFGNKIISGEHIFNLKSLFALVENVAIVSPEMLEETLAQRATLLPAHIQGEVDLTPFYHYIESELSHGQY